MDEPALDPASRSRRAEGGVEVIAEPARDTAVRFQVHPQGRRLGDDAGIVAERRATLSAQPARPAAPGLDVKRLPEARESLDDDAISPHHPHSGSGEAGVDEVLVGDVLYPARYRVEPAAPPGSASAIPTRTRSRNSLPVPGKLASSALTPGRLTARLVLARTAMRRCRHTEEWEMTADSSGFELHLENVMPAPPAARIRCAHRPRAAEAVVGRRRLHDAAHRPRPSRRRGLPVHDAAPGRRGFHLRGEFREVEPPTRLAYTFEWEERAPDDVETLAELTLRDLGDETEVVLDQGDSRPRSGSSSIVGAGPSRSRSCEAL